MEDKLEIRVYNKAGEDVTGQAEWYIDKNGLLYFETNDIDDIDCPLCYTEDFDYEILLNGKVVV